MNSKKARKPQMDYEDIDSESEEEKTAFKSIDILDEQKEHDFHLYTRLNITKTASAAEVKKAYRVASLRVHPDKNPDDPSAAQKFQEVNEAYVILSDETKRKRYDLTGEVDDDNLDELVNKCRFFYKEFWAEDIDDFATRYKGSKDEEEDLLRFYEENAGDLTKILYWIPLSENSDVDRFVGVYDRLIKEKVIKGTKLFKESRNNIELTANEEAEAAQATPEKKREKKSKKKAAKPDTSFQELQNKILAKKAQTSNNFLSSLASKYCDVDDPMGDMPSEEEFQRIQKNIAKKKTKAVPKKGKRKA